MSAAAETRDRGLAALRPAVLAGLALLLAACATPRAPRTLLPVAAQEQLLRELPRFSVDGRVSVQAGDKAEIISLDWEQRGDAVRARLSGPFGAGALTVDWSPVTLRLTRGDEVHEGAEAEAMLRHHIGLVPPFDAMRFWLLGLAAPGEAPTRSTPSSSGRIGELTQRQWQIRYDEWMGVAAKGGGVQLPRRMNINRDDLRLRVIVRRWSL